MVHEYFLSPDGPSTSSQPTPSPIYPNVNVIWEIEPLSSKATISPSRCGTITTDVSELKELSSSTISSSESELYVNKDLNISTSIAEERVMAASRPKENKRKRRYIRDLCSSDFSTPTKAKKNFRLLKGTIMKQRKQVKVLQGNIRRLKKKVTTLNELLKVLKDKSYINESSEIAIKASLSAPAEAIFQRMLQGPTNEKFDPVLRSFALTLSYYSSRGYEYVRKTFNNSLPHLGTISKWYRTMDGSPGFTQEALNALRIKQEEATARGHKVLCNLVLDEMSIRQQVEWTGSKFTGYVDVGTNLVSDVLPEAKEVLVFMLVCLNSSWKIPVGYFFLDGLSGTVKAELVMKCLEFLHETGIVVTSLTFDGAPVNFTMAANLGAKLSDHANLDTSFLHPITKEKVFIILDPSHMIKLVRNAFGSQKIFRDGSSNEINWHFLENLVETQVQEGLHVATKIRLRHMHWTREPMRVKLATQTLSKSVADALLFLGKDLQMPVFRDCEPTANFVLIFNNLFDVFNSHNRLAKYLFKKPLSPSTQSDFFSFLDDAKKYILSLKLGNMSVLSSPRKTGFLGFLICIESLHQLYNTYVVDQKMLKYMLTHKLSQDHLELFFGAIRSKGGFNNNPSARQFESAYKRLLVHSEISGPNSGNSINLEKVAILTGGTHQIITNEHGEKVAILTGATHQIMTNEHGEKVAILTGGTHQIMTNEHGENLAKTAKFFTLQD